MARNKVDKDKAAEIVRLRDQGWSDQRIIAEKGSGAIADGFRWLEQNPGIDPLSQPSVTPKVARPARGSGSRPMPERISALI